MKKLLFSLLILFCCHSNVSAQEVFNTVLKKSKAIVENPDATPTLKLYNQFKVDALTYMAMKMREEMPDSSATLLDREAYALNNFISLYMSTLLELRNALPSEQIKVIKLFMDASYSNPLFNDSDGELVLSYFADGNSLTRFSLDTDWRRAYIAVATELKKQRENRK